MKKLFAWTIHAAFSLLFASTVYAADRATAEEAVDLVKKAAAYIKANGKERAFEEFNNPNGKFKDRDLYIFALDFNGKVLAHGANNKLIGKSLYDIKDADGKYFVKGFIETGTTKGSGWTDYKWVNPVTSAIERKSGYVLKVDDFLVGSGIYKE